MVENDWDVVDIDLFRVIPESDDWTIDKCVELVFGYRDRFEAKLRNGQIIRVKKKEGK